MPLIIISKIPQQKQMNIPLDKPTEVMLFELSKLLRKPPEKFLAEFIETEYKKRKR